MGVTTTNPIDAGILGFARDTRPDIAFEAVEGQHTSTIGMPSGLPTIHKAVAPQGGVGGAGRSDIEVAHDDGRQVGEGRELAGDDVD